MCHNWFRGWCFVVPHVGQRCRSEICTTLAQIGDYICEVFEFAVTIYFLIFGVHYMCCKFLRFLSQTYFGLRFKFVWMDRWSETVMCSKHQLWNYKYPSSEWLVTVKTGAWLTDFHIFSPHVSLFSLLSSTAFTDKIASEKKIWRCGFYRTICNPDLN